MKPIEATLTLRNNLLKERRLRLGYTQKEIAMLMGLNVNDYGRAELLKSVRASVVEKICAFHECLVDDLFPDEVLGIDQTRFIRYYESREISLHSPEVRKMLPMGPPDEVGKSMDTEDMRRQVESVLDSCLMPTERKIIKMHFGIGGLKYDVREIADKLTVTRFRVENTIVRVIRKLSWYGGRRKLADYVKENIKESERKEIKNRDKEYRKLQKQAAASR